VNKLELIFYAICDNFFKGDNFLTRGRVNKEEVLGSYHMISVSQ